MYCTLSFQKYLLQLICSRPYMSDPSDFLGPRQWVRECSYVGNEWDSLPDS